MKTIQLLRIRNRAACIIAGLFILFNAGSFAQEVLIRLNLPPIDQFTVNDLYNAQVINNSGKDLQIFLKGIVTEETKGLLFDGHSAVFTLKAGFNGLPAFSQLEPVSTNYSNKKVESYVLRTGTVPPGEYTICIYVIDATTQEELGEDCIQTELLAPMPPELIYPEDESQVEEMLLLFSWAPPAPVSITMKIIYKIRIVELLPHQTVDQALASNPAWYQNNQVSGTTFQYPANARPLETGKTYAWQVTAYTQTGEQIAPPSEPYWFQVPVEPEIVEPFYIKLHPLQSEDKLDINDALTFTWELIGHPKEPYTYLFQLFTYDLDGPPPELTKEKLVFSKGDINETKLVVTPNDIQLNERNGYIWIVYLLTKEHYLFPDSIFSFTFKNPKQFDFGDAPDSRTSPSSYFTLKDNSGGRCYWMTKVDISRDFFPSPVGITTLGVAPWVPPGPPSAIFYLYIPKTIQTWLGLLDESEWGETGYVCRGSRSVDFEEDSRIAGGTMDNFDDGVLFYPGTDYCKSCGYDSIEVKFMIDPEYEKGQKLYFSCWVDWNGDGDWYDGYNCDDEAMLVTEHIRWLGATPLYATSTAPVLMGNLAEIDPSTWHGQTCAVYRFYFQGGITMGDMQVRFRLSPDIGSGIQLYADSPKGMTISGEIEDYLISCGNPRETRTLETVRSCDGLADWTQTIVSNTDVLVDADDNRICSRRDYPVAILTRPGCPYTPAGAQWIEDPSSGSGTGPHPSSTQFIRCFEVDGCLRNACLEFISPASFGIYLNDHVIGIHPAGCTTSSFSVPDSYFILGGTNVLRFDHSVGTSGHGYRAFAFALHIESEPGLYESDEPELSLVHPTGTSTYYQCLFTGSGYVLEPRHAFCIPDPSATSTDHILINITDVSGIADLMINATYTATPTSSTDCATFLPESSSFVLTAGSDYTTTTITGGIQVSIQVSSLYILFPGITLPGILDLDFFVTDGACIPNVLQQELILKLGCE